MTTITRADTQTNVYLRYEYEHAAADTLGLKLEENLVRPAV